MASLNNNNFPFLSFPAEIRNPIYRHLLVGDPDITAAPHAQILRTCRRINREATGILYAENIFKISVDWRNVRVYRQLLFTTDTSLSSPDFPDVSGFIPDISIPPRFSTDIPLHRVENLEFHIRGVLRFWDYEDLQVKTLERNVLRLCRQWPEQHALKKLTTSITWHAPSDFGPPVHLSDPEGEASILAPFSMLQNIQSVSIRGSIRPEDAMHG